MIRRIAVVATLLAATAGLGACGNKKSVELNGDSEGAYIDVGPLKYQVQLSRALQPTDPEDADYLKGIVPAESSLPTGDVWFAVFVRVSNYDKKPHTAATDYSIEDTVHHHFFPVSYGPDNPFAYQNQKLTLEPKNAKGIEPGLLPDQDATATFGPTQGALLMFRIPQGDLDNRPLVLYVKDPQDRNIVGTVQLDV